MKVKPFLYVIIAAAFAALLYVINIYHTMEGFDSEILAHFENMPSDQKEMVCKTINEQIESYKHEIILSTVQQRDIIDKDIEEMKKTASGYGC